MPSMLGVWDWSLKSPDCFKLFYSNVKVGELVKMSGGEMDEQLSSQFADITRTILSNQVWHADSSSLLVPHFWPDNNWEFMLYVQSDYRVRSNLLLT